VDNRECRGPFQSAASIILASGSPRRKELLERLGLKFEINAASSKELGPDSGFLPADLVQRNACIKAAEAAAVRPESFIIGADTCVALSGKIFGKPENMEDAVSMLMELSGRWHRVFTAYCVLRPEIEVEVLKVVESRVYLTDFGQGLIRKYCATGEPLDKAGAYAVQGIGSFMVSSIEGSWTNVVGLPMTELVETLLETGAIEPCAGNWKK